MPSTEKRSVVSVVSVTASIPEAVRQAMDLASWKSALKRGAPTALKVNLGWDLFIPGSITSPWVVEGVILTIRDWVGKLYLVESDQVLENIEKAYRKSGMPALCEKYGVTWVNMSNSAATKRTLPGARIFKEIELPDILSECQMVTIPVMKTHAKTRLTGSLKNQWGCISKLRHNFHLTLSDSLADINSALRPAFAVMDATIGLEGNGPKSGRPKVINRILASSDLVAMDTVQAKLMGLDPTAIEHLQTCAGRGLGTSSLKNIDIVGDKDAPHVNLAFQPARHNLVSRIEELLRRSRWKRLFFDTPVFLIMLFGAKIWYLIWFYAVSGRKHWNAVLNDPHYGPLWRKVRENQSL
ncbi:MAG TPA: DUF362 domain-containing protein [Bacteroidota bacterium]